MKIVIPVYLILLSFLNFACSKEEVPKVPVPTPTPMPTSVRTVTVSVDATTKFQTMEGFGGYGSQKPWWLQAPFFDAAFIDLLISDLGVKILRDNIPIGFEPENDNDDPYDIDWSKFNFSKDTPGADSHLGQHFPYLKAMQEAGLEKLIVSVWSPPIWMKHNNHRGNGTNDQTSAPEYTTTPDENTNQLKVENYEEFAEFCVAYIKLLKQETGIDLYAISLQNEPRFSQFYGSAVYSFESLRDVIKVVGTRFEKENIDTKIFAPEDVQSIWHINRYLDAIINDEEALKYLDIFAIHNYRNDGVTPSDEGPDSWRQTFEKANAANKSLWMSETSGFDEKTLEGGLNLATSMYNAMHFGHANAWVYWRMSESNDHGFITDGKPTWLYHISKQFYRHIMPGAIRIKVEESEDKILTLAFEHPDKGTKTLVLINIGIEDVSIKLTGDFAGFSFKGRLTNSKNKYMDTGTLKGDGGGIELSAKSILTLEQ